MSINVSNVNFFYGNTQTLFDINFSANEGDTIVLLGRSGAGKSTLIRILNLLATPTSGSLEVFGHKFDLANQIDIKSIQELRKNVGMIFQQYNLWPHMTVLENLIKAPMQVLGISKAEAIARAEDLLKRLQITEFMDRYPLMLSGGQQQRVAIARALMMQPAILLFDEPTAALDPEITEQIANIINELQETGITQIIVTHEVAFAKKIATRVIYMEKGIIVEDGDVSSFDNPKTPEFAQYLSH